MIEPHPHHNIRLPLSPSARNPDEGQREGPSLRCNPARRLARRLAPAMVPALALAVAFLVPGCIGNPWNPATTQPVTEVDPATTQPAYWLSLPPTTQVASDSFTRLWDAAEHAIRNSYFVIDRRDYRSGLLTSEPMVSKQAFELWRKDAPTGEEALESSIAPIRRTIHIQFTRNSDNTFTAAPRVLVERYARVEQKLQSVVDYQPSYWYPLRRDVKMEKAMAEEMRKNLR